MSKNLIYVLEILFSLIGIFVIFVQNPKTIQNSFVANSLETFKFKNVKHNYLFWATIIMIIVVAILVLIDVKLQ